MVVRHAHLFPARMAPQLALDALQNVRPNGHVLDPMCGSGTVLLEAVRRGLPATGRDVDPLAVLMSRVATSNPDPISILRAANRAVRRAHKMLEAGDLLLPRIDDDPKAVAYVRFWFGLEQERELRALARAIDKETGATGDLLRLALSRMIIRKESGASLARDVSHSRPHRVASTSTFEVLASFRPTVDRILASIDVPPHANVSIRLGDARNLSDIDDGSIAAVVTSPPYLNAIDYIRGHRLALVWLGESLDELRRIRSSSIGAERAPGPDYDLARVDRLLKSCVGVEMLPPRIQNVLRRFAGDIDMVLGEIARVLEAGGRAVVVIGNSTIRGVRVDNAAVVSTAAQEHGLARVHRSERELPPSRRYLPPPSTGDSSLTRRMRTETILTFTAPA